MIAADASELQTRLAQTVVHIRNKEVMLFTDQFGVLAGTATFLISLGFGGMTMSTNFLAEGEDHGVYCSSLPGCDRERNGPGKGAFFNNYEVINLYFALTALGIACHFACVFISMYSMIFGPELAIRGREREQKRAIKGMYEEREVALNLFWAGCASIVLSSAMLGWLKYTVLTGWAMTAIFTALLAGSAYYVLTDLRPRFDYVDAEGLDCSHFKLWYRERGSITSVDSRAPSVSSRGDSLAGGGPRSPADRLADAISGIFASFRGSDDDGLEAPSDRATFAEPAEDEDAFYATYKSGPLTVDGAPRHALLADGRLRVFAFDGAPLADLDLSAHGMDLDGSGLGFGLLARDSDAAVVCAGADLADTQHWIRAIVAACDADAADVSRFSDVEDETADGAADW